MTNGHEDALPCLVGGLDRQFDAMCRLVLLQHTMVATACLWGCGVGAQNGGDAGDFSISLNVQDVGFAGCDYYA